MGIDRSELSPALQRKIVYAGTNNVSFAKGHERHIHGHRHAGVRIVQEGPTLIPVLDAHLNRREPFTAAELLSYRNASVPDCQTTAIRRRKIMRKARSKKQRPLLLKDLERRYRESGG